jgi:hypothetical protein
MKKMPKQKIRTSGFSGSPYFEAAVKYFITILLIFSGILLQAQSANTDSLQIKKNFTFAATQVIGLNLGVWSVDHYIAKAEWANISISSVKHNIKHGFVFDDSGFLMNQFLHPYHGNLYFNSARTNGFNFWGSAPFSLAGSIMWELFMEIEEPSNNDLFTTTMGGIMLGEITYRISSLILDDTAVGTERIWRELTAGLLNPVRGINRLIGGRTGKINTHSRLEKKPVIGIISFGGNNVGEGLDLQNSTNTPLLKMQFVYGSPFEKDEFRKPFEYFNLHLGINISNQNTISNFFGEALLYGKNFNFQGNLDSIVQDNLIGVFQHFDYLANQVYKVSASAIGGGVISRFPAYEGMVLYTSCHLNGIVLGGSNSAYAEKSGRDYNLGPGFSSKLEGWLVNEKYGELYISYLNYWIYTLSGAAGNETITITNGRIETPLWRNIGLGLEYLYYQRKGVYDNFEDIEAYNNEFRTYISLHF